MKRTFLFISLLAMILMAGYTMMACSSDDDDDDNDDSGSDCSTDTLCSWAVNQCEVYPDAESCMSDTEGCTDVAGAIACLCDCMSNDPTCEDTATGDCALNCQTSFCS